MPAHEHKPTRCHLARPQPLAVAFGLPDMCRPQVAQVLLWHSLSPCLVIHRKPALVPSNAVSIMTLEQPFGQMTEWVPSCATLGHAPHQLRPCGCGLSSRVVPTVLSTSELPVPHSLTSCSSAFPSYAESTRWASCTARRARAQRRRCTTMRRPALPSRSSWTSWVRRSV